MSIHLPGGERAGITRPSEMPAGQEKYLTEPTAQEGPTPAKPSTILKLWSANAMCTWKVPDRNCNPCRRRCHVSPSPSGPWSACGAHDGSHTFCSAAPLPWAPAPLNQWSRLNPDHHHYSSCQAHQVPLYQHLRPPWNLSVGCWSLFVWLGFLPTSL